MIEKINKKPTDVTCYHDQNHNHEFFLRELSLFID